MVEQNKKQIGKCTILMDQQHYLITYPRGNFNNEEGTTQRRWLITARINFDRDQFCRSPVAGHCSLVVSR